MMNESESLGKRWKENCERAVNNVKAHSQGKIFAWQRQFVRRLYHQIQLYVASLPTNNSKVNTANLKRPDERLNGAR
jgi:ubiquinone biosynthesis protein UbiJ